MAFWKEEVLIINGLVEMALYLGHKISCVCMTGKKKKKKTDI